MDSTGPAYSPRYELRSTDERHRARICLTSSSLPGRCRQRRCVTGRSPTTTSASRFSASAIERIRSRRWAVGSAQVPIRPPND